MSCYTSRWTLVTLIAGASAFTTALVGAQGAGTPTANIQRPKAVTVSSGHCLRRADGTFGAVFGPDALPPLAFTIGPGSAMADQMHANKAPFTGPGQYKGVIIMLYLGKTATQDTYGGLGTVTVASDAKSGTFQLDDGTASGRWNCGNAVARQSALPRSASGGTPPLAA